MYASFLNLQIQSEELKAEMQNLNQKYTDTVSLVESKEKDRQAIAESLKQIGLDYNNLTEKYNQSMGEVLTLKRTEEIDDELLKKYSKFYFLNENYVPKDLVSISTNFTNGKDIKLIPMTKFRLEQMILVASTSGVKIQVNSGYRSFAEQKGLKSSYSQTFGISKANSFSADQGYSEHQLGTTVDLSDGKNVLQESFDKTKSYEWLRDNAYLYGFILSYPKDNKYYVYEPWHYRFVGIELAKYLHDNKKNFYDLDQKFIDQFKLKMFE
jgi:D-alanyl-D-alanine carboxypeptidase